MKTSLSWLRQYVDITTDPRELAFRMTLAGVEAESVRVVGGWEGVVVGTVTAVQPHPNADRLRLATVDYGTGTETVVCGAPNVATGQKIAFARVGAKLLDGHTGQPSVLKPAKIRGVESRGMVCSERELGLSEQHEGILVLPPETPIGKPLTEVLGDVIFDFAVTANRPDCLSVLGLAREAAAITNKQAREPDLAYLERGQPVAEKTRVEILDADLCPRYIAAVITGVRIGPSPKWMQDRLAIAGMRPINNIVDITNYVMLEYGQPLHAFDYDKLAEHRIVVRRAKAGEAITTIDGQSRKLTPEVLVIADASRPVAMAGVMGGADSEVSERTVSVLLESAAFDNVSIRNTSRGAGLRSEASLRFEKGLSRELPRYAAKRAMQLMVELAGGTACEGVVDVYPGKHTRQPVRLTHERLRRVLGVDIALDEASHVLGLLGFTTHRDGEALSVTVPYWRMDIAIEEDLIEEIVRIRGYESVPTVVRVGNLPPFEPEPLLALKEHVRDALAAAGMSETVTYSVVSAKETLSLNPLPQTGEGKKAGDRPVAPPVHPSTGSGRTGAPLRLWNPMSAEHEFLRTSMRPSLLRTLAHNQRVADGGVRLFEVGKVYLPRAEELPDEREVLAAVLSGPRVETSWLGNDGQLDFLDGKGVLEALFEALGVAATWEAHADSLLHPGRSARIVVNGTAIGVLGEVQRQAAKEFDLLDRPAVYFEIDLRTLVPLLPKQGRGFEPVARFPGVTHDLALVLDASVPAEQVAAIIRATPLVREVTLFDVYTGDKLPAGKRQLAYRVLYQAPDRTLTSEEADKAQERLLARLQKEVGATLRA